MGAALPEAGLSSEGGNNLFCGQEWIVDHYLLADPRRGSAEKLLFPALTMGAHGKAAPHPM